MEIGVYTFAELQPEPAASFAIDPARRLRDLIEEVELADEVGLDVFGVGEHHRPECAVSAPAVVLAAAAERTKAIRLTSAVSVISSDDPARVFQDFATLDLLSGGRAEIMAGRGSFIESFPLFGYHLDDYDELFAEKLELCSSFVRARGSPGRATTGRRSTGSASDESFPAVVAMMNRIGRERGWAAMTRADYEAAATLRGANFVGTPKQVTEKILFQHEIFRHDRFLLQLSVGTLPHEKILHAIELFGTEVAPAVRAEIARQRTSTSRTSVSGASAGSGSPSRSR
jgi:alkanesulfonate monooxygenase SsuD/methylene tetrahydromethanopterin reductase-like flavin-dependent oxidoreductase (luciferase family)